VSTALPQNVKLVLQLTTSEDPFHFALGSALSKINERKKFKYSIQH